MFLELVSDLDGYNFYSVLSVHLTSSKSLDGVTGVASEIQKEKKVAYDIHLKAVSMQVLKDFS